MRNKEYRDKLVDHIESANNQIKLAYTTQVYTVCHYLLEIYKDFLAEYDRLHPETIDVEQAKVTDRRGYKDLPADRHGCVTVFDNLSGCNITLIDNVLNVIIE